jgi:chorismate dehydratase
MMNNKTQHELTSPAGYQVGGVRFFNARPLLYGLEAQGEIELVEAPPAHLADDLNQGKFHAALVPSIDYQMTSNPWTILGQMAIGSNGPVLTVQVFSRCRFEEIKTLACDLDSHSSVVLAQILFQQCFNTKLNIVPLADDPDSHTAVLLIGDKVLEHLDRWPHQLDLGEQWDRLTGLPFVYAFWALPDPAKCEPLVAFLQEAARQGMAHLEEMIDQANDYGFSPDLARQYLTENLSFELGPEQRRGLTRFYELAYDLNLIPRNRPLNFYLEQEPISVP